MSTLGDLAQLFSGGGADRAALQGLMRAASELAQSLSGLQVMAPPDSVLQMPEWFASYDRAATAGHAPSAREYFGVSLNPLPQEPPLPWALIVGQYATREPGIADALRSIAQAYATIEQTGSPALRRSVNDVVVRRWAQARLERETGTSPTGSGAGPRPLAPAPTGPSMLPLLAVAGAGALLLAKSKGSGLLPLAALAGAVMLGSRGPGNFGGGSFAGVPGAGLSNARSPLPTPDRYAEEKRGQLLARWRDVQPRTGSLGDALVAYSWRIFPGIPAPAFLGFTAIATGRTERTSANEIGYFQTPERTYGRLATEAARIIGRPVNVREWQTDVEAQCVIGLLDLKNHLDEMIRLGWRASEGTVWQCALAFAAFSAGAGAVSNAWAPFRDEVHDLPEQRRFERIAEVIALSVRQGHRFSPPSAHPNPAYTWLRTAQKLACGREVAAVLQRDADAELAPFINFPWFPTFAPEIQRAVALAAAGMVETTNA